MSIFSPRKNLDEVVAPFPGSLARWTAPIGLLISLGLLLAGPASALSETPTDSRWVTGTLLDDDRKPFQGAEVQLVPFLTHFEQGLLRLHGVSAEQAEVKTTTGEDGRFRLEVPSSGLYKLRAQATGRLPMQLYPLALTDSIEAPALVLDRAMLLKTCWIDSEKKPIVGAWVAVEGQSDSPAAIPSRMGWRPVHRRAQTNPSGCAVLPRALGERLTVRAHGSDPELGFADSVWTGIQEDLRAAPARGEIRSLRVVDSQGRPAPGVQVWAGKRAWPKGLTDEAGRLQFRVSGDSESISLLTENGWQTRVKWQPGDGEDLILEAPDELTGRVVSRGGRAVSKALVWMDRDPGRFIRTDSIGRYQFVRPGPEPVIVQAEHHGYLPQAARLASVLRRPAPPKPKGSPDKGSFDPSSTDLSRVPTLTLERKGRVSGKVLDRLGRGVAGAQVVGIHMRSDGRPKVLIRADRAGSRAVTGPDGDFELSGIQGDELYRIIASFPGRHTVETLLPVPRAGLEKPVLLVLPTGRPGVGQVVDTQDRPVMGARVRAFSSGLGFAMGASQPSASCDEHASCAVTDEKGLFRLDPLPAAQLDLSVRSQGYAPLTVRGIEVSMSEPSPASPSEPVNDLGTLVLISGGALEGRIVDPAGKGIEGAQVAVVESRLQPFPAAEARALKSSATFSDQDGSFRVEGLPIGMPMDLLADAEGYVATARRGIEAQIPPSDAEDSEARRELSLILQLASRVSGRVVDRQGDPVAGARVTATRQELLENTDLEMEIAQPEIRAAISTSEGFFEIHTVPLGSIEVAAETEGWIPSAPLVLNLGVDGATGLEILLDPGFRVSGRVVTDLGAPVAEAWILMGRTSAFTDAEGLYRLSGIAEGPQSAMLRHQRYSNQNRQVQVDGDLQDLDWVLAGGRSVSGRALDLTSLPLAGVEIRLSYLSREDHRVYRTVSDEEGFFDLEEVVDGTYSVETLLKGYAPAVDQHAIIGPDMDDLEIRLRPGGVIRGLVTGLDFDELSRVEIQAKGPAGTELTQRLDYEGRFQLEDLPFGPWRLVATLDAGQREADARVILDASRHEAERELAFQSSVVVEGEVLYDGEPAAEAWISLVGQQRSTERTVKSDFEGRFRFEDVEPGTYHLGLRFDRQALTANRRIEVAENHFERFDLQAVQVAGRVIDQSTGEPLSNAVVKLQLIQSDGEKVAGLIVGSSEADGRFYLPRVSRGRYSLDVRRDGYVESESAVLEVYSSSIDDLELSLQPAAGLEIKVSLAGGEVPRWIDIRVTNNQGQVTAAESRHVSADGRAYLSTVPPGAGFLTVGAKDAAETTLAIEVPSEIVQVVLPEAGGLRVEVPDLYESSLLATLTLATSEGTPFVGMGTVGRRLSSWPLEGGSARLESLPAGSWILKVTTPDGRLWTQAIQTSGQDQLAVLR